MKLLTVLPDSIIIAHDRIAGWAMTILTTGASAKPACRLLGWVGADEHEEPAPSPRSSSWPSISRLRRPNVVVNALAYDTEYASVRAKYAEPPREKAATCRRSRQRNADLVSPSV
jgi:hypothetical protein